MAPESQALVSVNFLPRFLPKVHSQLVPGAAQLAAQSPQPSVHSPFGIPELMHFVWGQLSRMASQLGSVTMPVVGSH